MTQAQHTPGPWAIEKSTADYWYVNQVNDDPYRGPVCVVHDAEHIDGITQREAEANAKLIAQAPDLLDNLKNLCNVFGQGLDPVKNECAYRAIENAKAAIERAEA